ncbi:hypothetical protein [Burkholderia diffusa]|uniref:hypothetical protein n=1 Tax=Burkholderia diffusa TaxID=488732 RepID=UPI002AAFC51F|nr:hypothetical protein [Burkholderia diffusa]
MAISGKRSGGAMNGGPRNAPPIGDDRVAAYVGASYAVRLCAQPLRRACRAAPISHRPAAWRRASVGNVGDIDAPRRYRNNAREAAILEMPTCRVLARLRIPHDDFGIYQGYRRYAEIVAGRASNAQDARIFAT